MGYILMISHDQYKQYQERMVPVKSKPIHTMPITKIRNEKEFDLYRSLEKENSKKENDRRQVTKTRRLNFEHLAANLTGKGKYINEYI